MRNLPGYITSSTLILLLLFFFFFIILHLSGWIKLFGQFFTPPGTTHPIEALLPWPEASECWCTPADEASLGVRVTHRIKAAVVTIEYVTARELVDSGSGLANLCIKAAAVTIEYVTARELVDGGSDLATMPKIVEIWGRA